MLVTIIPIVIGAFGTVTKGLLKRLEDLEVDGRAETIQTTSLLGTTRIPRTALKTSTARIPRNGQNTGNDSGDLLSLRLQ